MLRPRDLPIAAKLGLSACCALLLLGALTWTVRDSMVRLSAIDQRNAAAEAAARELATVRTASLEMRVASREIEYQQSVAAVQSVLRGAEQQAGKAREVLQAVASGDETEGGRKLLSDAKAALATYTAALQRAAELRSAVLDTREKTFFPLYKPFMKGLDNARAGLAAEDIPYAEMAPLRSALEEYGASINTMRTVTLRFLATGDRSEELSLKDGAANAEAAVATMLAGRLSDDIKGDIRKLAEMGTAMQHSATELFAAASRSDAFTQKDLEAASGVMRDSLALCVRDFAARAEAARAEADAAMDAARQRTLMYAAGIAVLMLASGLLTARAVARPIRAMTRAVQAMADGETGAAIGFAGRRDEIGRMAAALETLRGAVRKAFVQSQMIEQIPVGVMTADAGEARITYLNPESRRIMETVAESLPVPPDQLEGQGLALFHADAEEVRAILADPERLPYRTPVAIGGEVLEFCASAIRDRDGQYVGPMVTWTVMTGRVRLSERFERTVGTIAASVGSSAASMTETANAMSLSAAESGRFSVAVAGASNQAASNVQSVAASAEELAATVHEIGRQVAESARVAGQAVREAEDTDRCVSHLSEAATRIGDVVKLISDIAGRTNLLALNATIEAARAGEAGKGFAVVASEVKTLATQTARATQEIGAQIATMQGEVGQAVSALRSIGGTIQRMNEIATAIAGAVEQQGATTQEIARAVQHAAAGTAEVNGNINQVTEAVTHTGEQAGAVLKAARTLTAHSDTLKIEVAEFLTAVREAA